MDTKTFEHDALIIRTCAADGSGSHGFKWPLTVGAVVECPDWKAKAECGNGLHGLLDGIGHWELIDDSATRIWQVIGVIRAEVGGPEQIKAGVTYKLSERGKFVAVKP